VPQYVAPRYQEPKFTCPICGTLAEQIWWELHKLRLGSGAQIDRYFWCVCQSCEQPSLWRRDLESLLPGADARTATGHLVWPIKGGPPPHDDMPAEALRHYEQARGVLRASPQAAAALLRVATQAIVNHLVERDDLMLDRAIGQLVKEGRVRTGVQQACDVLRVTGNNMLHPGQISEREDDNQEVAERLFQLVNLIVEQAITEPALIERLYADLPPEKRAAIATRDATRS
jgi:Domain of unknown function (DUF4145)